MNKRDDDVQGAGVHDEHKDGDVVDAVSHAAAEITAEGDAADVGLGLEQEKKKTEIENIQAEDNLSQNTEDGKKTNDKLKDKGRKWWPTYLELLKVNRQWRFPTMMFLIVGMLALAALLVFGCWVYLIPKLWEWNGGTFNWRSILSGIGTFYLGIIPFLAFIMVPHVLDVIELYINDKKEELNQDIKKIKSAQEIVEEKLEANDRSGLVPLIKYSRLQMEAYYTIGLNQTYRSFRYSIIAMWIGFAVILFGIIVNYLPDQLRVYFSTGETMNITVASGVIIEVISALFLWVYRSSISQLTYFYNRQMYNHSVLICHRIADSMDASADDVRKMIVERLLDQKFSIGNQKFDHRPVDASDDSQASLSP